MVCLDTDLLVSLIRGNRRALKTIDSLERGNLPVSTTSITAYELFKGAGISANARHNLGLVTGLLSSLHILELDSSASEKAGEIYAKLNSRGRVIGEFDTIIAGICLAKDETLISNDEHFEKVEGLKLNRW